MAEEDLRRVRIEKLEALEHRGVDVWPPRFDRTHQAADLHETFANLEAGNESGKKVKVAGRLLSSRLQGKIGFGDLVDGSGKIQLFVPADQVAAFDDLDAGDIVGASGEVIRTKRGELSVRTEQLTLLAKALRPPPAKWHGLHDVETRYRQRYLDLLANEDARRLAHLRVEAVRVTRDFMDGRGFMEVETPVLHPIPGGAAAKPFVTHYNALGRDMYLRVAPELYLKRLVVGGLERVYELARVFRNEGMSYKHSPEATMLEAYQAYADYFDMMELVQTLTQTVARETTGTTRVTFRGHDFDLGGDWRRVTMHDLVSEATQEKVTVDSTEDELRAIAHRHNVATEPWWGAGMLVGELHDKVAEATVVEPTIVCDYPWEISPLARRHRDDPRLVERFEPIICGMELGNAFSELNDPIEQRKRFESQMEARSHGDVEANPIDEPYLEALEYGLPPTGGLGVGVDRMVMVIGGAPTIREVILFPALRPETDDDNKEGE
jgi:lysyl-tRNA synthetase, class II